MGVGILIADVDVCDCGIGSCRCLMHIVDCYGPFQRSAKSSSNDTRGTLEPTDVRTVLPDPAILRSALSNLTDRYVRQIRSPKHQIVEL